MALLAYIGAVEFHVEIGGIVDATRVQIPWTAKMYPRFLEHCNLEGLTERVPIANVQE